MANLLLWIQTTLVPWLGAPGVFVVAFLDSSFLSLPEISDILVVTSALRDPKAGWLAAAMADLGSLAGCAALFWIGRKGGESLLRRRIGQTRLSKTRAAFVQWDVLAVAVPAVMPPPMPFKAFVLAAGAFRVPFDRFALSVLVARGLRYAVFVCLAIAYGGRALEILKALDAASTERAGFLALLLILAVGVWLWVKRRRLEDSSPTNDAAL